jgi:hypothetical protein
MIEIFVIDEDGTELARWQSPVVPARGDLLNVAGSVRTVIHPPLWFPPSAVVLTVGR